MMTHKSFTKIIDFITKMKYPSENACNFLKVTGIDKYDFYELIKQFDYEQQFINLLHNYLNDLTITINRYLFIGEFKIKVIDIDFLDSEIVLGLRVVKEKIRMPITNNSFNDFLSFTTYLNDDLGITWNDDDNESLSEDISHEIFKNIGKYFYLPNPDILWG